MLEVATVSFDCAVPGTKLVVENAAVTPDGTPLTASFNVELKPLCTDPQLIWVYVELLGFMVRLEGAAANVHPTALVMVSDNCEF